MRIVGRGRIVVWKGASLWVLAALQDDTGTAFHAHHAVQITISLDGRFTIRTPHHCANGPITAVAADTQHVFEATGTAVFLFVAPESPAGRAIAKRLFAVSGLAEIDPKPLLATMAALHECFLENGPTSTLIKSGRAILDAVAGEQVPVLPHPRVQAMLDFIESHLHGPLSLKVVAACAHLSPSRARHLFAADTGLPFKAYVLWRRLECAVELYAVGRSLTEAAHEAGFADSAHLSRTFRKTFGIPASLLEVG